MRIAVTGAAGFIGSHLCERLLQEPDNEVLGIDAFVGAATPEGMRRLNIAELLHHPRFTFLERNLLHADWETILPNVDTVFHLAGMPGVRSSWGTDFDTYVDHNIRATQRLLEGCKKYPVGKLVYASTSSVYGEQLGRVSETSSTQPLSPYGVSKLTGEQLCRVYHVNDGVPIVVLRFFTVYGPRQRPDMAFHRFIRQMLLGEPITLFGDGSQSRDFTYVTDCTEAIAAVLRAEGVIGETINIGGKQRATVRECIAMLEDLFGQPADIAYTGSTYGEPKSTWADIAKARQLLGYEPVVDLQTGLANEIAYLRRIYP